MALLDSYDTGATSAWNAVYSGAPAAFQTFSVVGTYNLSSAKFYINKLGSPTGNANYKVYAITGTPGSSAVPTGSALATSDNLNVATLTTSYVLTELQFSGANSIVLNTGNYALTVEYSGGDTLNYVGPGYNSTSTDAGANGGVYFSGAWNAFAGDDLPFYVYGLEPLQNSRDIVGKAYIASAAPSSMPVQGIVGGWGSSTIGGQSAGEVLRPLTLTVDRVITGNARVSTLTSRTIVGNARITAVTTKTITGNARITNVVTRTIVGNARITVTVDRTITGNARIQTVVDRTIAGNSRITKSVDQTITGNARITVTTDRTITGNARISIVTDRTIAGNARITSVVDRTISGNANIISAIMTTDRTITGNARIAVVTTRTITGNASILKTVDRTISGNARIQTVVSRTISGNARISVLVSKTITGNARITQVVDRTINGNASIRLTVDRTITGNARIQVTTTRTITGNARIQFTTDRTIAGNARIASFSTRTIVGNARVVITTTQIITGNATVTKYVDPEQPQLNTSQEKVFANIIIDRVDIQISSEKPKFSSPEYKSDIGLISNDKPTFR